MLFICPEPSVTKARVRTKSLKLGKAKKRRTDKSAYLFIHFVKTVFCQIRIQCLLLRPSHVLVISLVPIEGLLPTADIKTTVLKFYF